MKPTEIETSGVKVVRIVRDTGDGGWSIALLRNPVNQEYHGIRWNGAEGENGYPTSRGKPVWFSLPDEVAVVLVAHYRANEIAAREADEAAPDDR